MNSFSIYNTDNYETRDFLLNVKIISDKNNDILLERNILPDKCIIWKIDDNYGLIDIYSNSSRIINDIQMINNSIKEAINIKESIDIQLKIYPNKNQQDIYIKLEPNALNSFSVIDRNIIKDNLYCTQISISNNIVINYEGKEFKDIIKDFESTTQIEAKLTDEEIDFIKNIVLQENSPDWYIQKNQIKKKKPITERLKFLSKPQKQQPTEVVIQEKGNEIFDKNALKIQSGSEHPMEDLSEIIGLDNIRHEIEKLKYTLEYKQERESRGIKDDSANNMHMCFYGSPGTGKTTIARIMTGLLYEMGYIKENRCVEINGLEFKGGYVGQTEIITKEILDASLGGVLFVDEAYALCNGSDDSYGKEAVNTFIKEMEDNRDQLIIIFAGYEKDMEQFLDMNSGFRSRINRYFKFEDYTVIELTQILINRLRHKHLKITEESLKKAMIIFKKAQKYHEFGNGRFVNNLLEKIEEEHMLNVVDTTDIERQDTISENDITDKIIEDIFKTLKY